MNTTIEKLLVLWKEHPSTRPWFLNHNIDSFGDEHFITGEMYVSLRKWGKMNNLRTECAVTTDHAIHLSESGLLRWLVEHDQHPKIWKYDNGYSCTIKNSYSSCMGNTLLDVLIDAVNTTLHKTPEHP